LSWVHPPQETPCERDTEKASKRIPGHIYGDAAVRAFLQEELARLAAFVFACLMTRPGVFQGRAGMAGALSALDGDSFEVISQVARLAWHAVHRNSTPLIPGSHLMRYSADLATGAAGVVLALHCVFDKPEGGLLEALLPM
jgi:hypothetical protein